MDARHGSRTRPRVLAVAAAAAAVIVLTLCVVPAASAHTSTAGEATSAATNLWDDLGQLYATDGELDQHDYTAVSWREFQPVYAETRFTSQVTGTLDHARVRVTDANGTDHTLDLADGAAGWTDRTIDGIHLAAGATTIRFEAGGAGSANALLFDSIRLVRTAG